MVGEPVDEGVCDAVGDVEFSVEAAKREWPRRTRSPHTPQVKGGGSTHHGTHLGDLVRIFHQGRMEEGSMRATIVGVVLSLGETTYVNELVGLGPLKP